MREIPLWFGLTDVESADETVVVIGCPFDTAASGRAGAAGGPAAIRAWSRTAEAIDERGRAIHGLRVVDVGDVDADEGVSGIEAAALRALRTEPDAVLLGLGGDHAVTPPLLAAVDAVHPGVGLVMIDAHADLFDQYDGDRHSHACVVARAWDEVGLEPARTALVGLRSFARAELAPLGHCGAAITAAEWMSSDAETVAARILRTVAGGPYYLSIDIDALDPSIAPGTGYPVAGGPSSRDLIDLLAVLIGQRPPAALDLVEVAPSLDPTGVTAATAAHVLLQALAGLAPSPA